MRRLFPCLLLAAALLGPVRLATAADLPKAGDRLPVLSLAAPGTPAHRAWLGIGNKATFGAADVAADLLLIEVVGVYCPICFEQAPTLRKLYARLTRDPAFKDRVKMVAVAAGATPEELEFARKQHKADYPLIADADYANHKLLGEPKTPFTLLVRRDGTVALTHLGKIEDESAFAAKIRGMLP
jgi:peroxiredoxin